MGQPNVSRLHPSVCGRTKKIKDLPSVPSTTGVADNQRTVTNIIIICIIFLHSLHIAKEHVGCPVRVFDVCSKQNTVGSLEAKLS